MTKQELAQKFFEDFLEKNEEAMLRAYVSIAIYGRVDYELDDQGKLTVHTPPRTVND